MNARERNVERVIPLIIQAVEKEDIEQVHAICGGLQALDDVEAAYLVAIATAEELLQRNSDLSRWFLDVFFSTYPSEVRQEVERVLREELIHNVGFPMTLHDRCVEIAQTLSLSLYQSGAEPESMLSATEPPEKLCPHLDL